MKQQHSDYQLITYPKLRRTMGIAERPFLRMPMIHGLIEVDVTRARLPQRAQSKHGGGPVVHGVHHGLCGQSRR
jgi:hypothetical protein